MNLTNKVALVTGGGGAIGRAVYRAMAKELGPKNIRVNELCPGMIDTSFHDIFTTDEVRARVAANTPLRREGKAMEVANLTAWLASAEVLYATGANVDTNGGLVFSYILGWTIPALA